jgi:hypothetical protein
MGPACLAAAGKSMFPIKIIGMTFRHALGVWIGYLAADVAGGGPAAAPAPGPGAGAPPATTSERQR